MKNTRGTIEGGITGLLLQNVDPIFEEFIGKCRIYLKTMLKRKRYWNLSDCKEIGDKMEQYGIKLLAYGMNGFRDFVNKKLEKIRWFQKVTFKSAIEFLVCGLGKSNRY